MLLLVMVFTSPSRQAAAGHLGSGPLPIELAHDPHLSFLDTRPLSRAAVHFAVERHKGQRRVGDHASFVAHPVEVASLLARSGYPDQVVAAGVLHDVLEDTDSQRGELEARFGQDVAELVVAVSDDPSIEGEEARKDDLRERVRHLRGYPAALYAADKISKVRELRTLMATGASRQDVEARVIRNRKSLCMLEATIPGSRLVELLRFELEELEELPPQSA